jgi:hypothetical protein
LVLPGAPILNPAVAPYDVVIPDILPALRLVPLPDLGYADVGIRWSSRAMHDDETNGVRIKWEHQ